MEQIKKNLAVKITAFVLLQFFVLVTVFSAAVVIFNVSQGWYSKDEESVRAEIFTETADFASGEIIDRYVNYGSQELERFFSGAAGRNNRFSGRNREFLRIAAESVSVQNSGGHSWIMRTCGSDCAIRVPYGIGRLRSEELWRNTEDDSAGFRGGGSRSNPGCAAKRCDIDPVWV